MTSIYHVPVVHFRACATLDQHGADAALSQLRPARSDVRDGAADRPGGAPARLRPRRVTAAEPVPETAMPYRNPFGTDDSGHYHACDGPRAGPSASGAASMARREEAKATWQARAASGSPTMSIPRPACRANGPRLPCSPKARWRLSSARVSSGQGHETSFAQLVGEWLGVPLESVVAGNKAIPRAFRWAAARIRAARCGSAAS